MDSISKFLEECTEPGGEMDYPGDREFGKIKLTEVTGTVGGWIDFLTSQAEGTE